MYPGALELIVSSSGKLTAQIEHGAPYDIFLSADMKYPKAVDAAGKALTRPKAYAYGKLVLWTLGPAKLTGLEMLTAPSVKTIAVANPAIAPYGVAAIVTLKKAGIYEAVRRKLVFGESISQVNQFLLSGAADVAFTALSVVKSPDLAGKGKWIEINPGMYQPIEQGVVILKHANQSDLKRARAFYDFLYSPGGRAVFNYFGYKVD